MLILLNNNNPLPQNPQNPFFPQTFSRANFVATLRTSFIKRHPPCTVARFARGDYNGRVGQVNAAPGRMKLTPGPR